MKIHKNSKYPVIIKSFLSGVVYEYLKNHVRGSYEILCDPMTIKMVIQAIKNLKNLQRFYCEFLRFFLCTQAFKIVSFKPHKGPCRNYIYTIINYMLAIIVNFCGIL